VTVRRAGSSPLITVSPATEPPSDPERFTEAAPAVESVAAWLAARVSEIEAVADSDC